MKSTIYTREGRSQTPCTFKHGFGYPFGEFVGWEQTSSFWRSDKHEVDFVSYGPLGLYAFEIKRNAVVRDKDLDGLRAFRTDYPVAQCFLLHGGYEDGLRDGVRLLPFAEGLLRLPELFGVTL